jgi:hypothetical protein
LTKITKNSLSNELIIQKKGSSTQGINSVDDYELKASMLRRNIDFHISGRTNLFYLQTKFWKEEGERKDRTKEVMEKVI